MSASCVREAFFYLPVVEIARQLQTIKQPTAIHLKAIQQIIRLAKTSPQAIRLQMAGKQMACPQTIRLQMAGKQMACPQAIRLQMAGKQMACPQAIRLQTARPQMARLW